jgi:hypothetical protein
MRDPGALRGPDIAAQLANPAAFGVSGAKSPDGVRTIELTTEPTVHGPHGSVRVRFATASDSVLTADISWGNRGRATCRSADSIRIWGAFKSDVDLDIQSPGEVRLFARSGAGAVLAGPTIVSSGIDALSFEW